MLALKSLVRTGRPLTQAVLTICVLCVLCGCALGQDWKTVHDGVEYAQVEREISGLKVKMNLLRLDLRKVRLDVHHALDKAIGLETTSSIATRHGGVAAINAGFFRLDKSPWAGDAAGILTIDGDLISESVNSRSALLIANRKEFTQIRLGHFTTRASIWIKNGTAYQYVSLKGINRERKTNETVLYTSQFGPSTRTSERGIEIVLSRCRWIHPRDFPDTLCKTVTVVPDSFDSKIPEDGFVVSIGPNFVSERGSYSDIYKFGQLKKRKGNAVLTLAIDEGPMFLGFDRSVDVTNGIPQLIKNDKIDITWEQEKTTKSFVETRHPRTAVAKLKDGKFFMMTVDGRSESSGGISLYDLADYLLSIGAVDAMNLDGGGSTTMYLDGKVVNTPSDKEGERKVGDAIVVSLRNPKKR